MRHGIARALLIVSAGLWLAGCNTNSGPFGPVAESAKPGANAFASAPEETTGSISRPAKHSEARQPEAGDDIAEGKQQFRANNFDRAAKHFSAAAERNPQNAEAWLGLAASYDRMRQFELADSAYDQAIRVSGPTAEILNNQGYSYMLRGDTRRARATLLTAQRKDPNNRYVANNLQLLAANASKSKAAY
jgi:Flp pilus assembly protein TadD